VLYLANPTGDPGVRDAIWRGRLGYFDNPRQGSIRPKGVVWCADNGCFGKHFHHGRWWTWLVNNADDAATCLFATAPDVVGDHEATMERGRKWLSRIRDLGYKAAFVAQNGATPENVPWDEFDVLFIGGDTEWKLSDAAKLLIAAAKARGMWVHCGRVNSQIRYRLMALWGCDSCDGTSMTFAPSTQLPRVLSWVREFEESK
jgi:hypothetical protein